MEGPTQYCKKGNPCLKQTDCGENGYCLFHKFGIGYILFIFYLLSTYISSTYDLYLSINFWIFSKCYCEGGNPLEWTKSEWLQEALKDESD